MELPIPAGIDDIDDAWMSQAMGAPLSMLDVSDIGEGLGMISSLHRVTLDGDGPDSVVVKLPSADEAARFTAQVLSLNIREVGFYRELAAECPVRVPAAHHAAVDRTTHEFVLVLEDMGWCRAVDQVAGMGAADAERAVSELADWHLHWWDAAEPIVERGTAVAISDPIYPAILPAVFAEGWEKVRTSMTVPPPIVAAAEGWIGALPRMLDSLAEEPTGLGHGDYRADNMLFDDDDRLVLLDFQVIGQATPVFDLAYFVTASLAPELASEMEPRLFERWRDAVAAGGRPESELESMWPRYRVAALFCVCYGMIAARGMDLSAERQRSLLAASFERFSRAAEELSLPDLL